jgi:hypothetical protein
MATITLRTTNGSMEISQTFEIPNDLTLEIIRERLSKGYDVVLSENVTLKPRMLDDLDF